MKKNTTFKYHDFFLLLFFSIQTVGRSGYYGIESPLPYIHNLKLGTFFLVAWVLEVKINNSVVLGLMKSNLADPERGLQREDKTSG